MPADAAPLHPFAAAGLAVTPELAAALAADGIAAPTPVQAVALAPLLAGVDAVVRSGTGTGKTLAYLLPILQRAAAEPALRALVLAPSPELAVQILRVAERYAAPGTVLAGLIGGGSTERQRERLKKHPQVMVATPGRALEFILARKIKAAQLAVLVLDEADQILEPDLMARLMTVLSRPEVAPQLVCASATLGAATQAFVGRCMRADHQELAPAAAAALPEGIVHETVLHTGTQREATLLRLLRARRVHRALVFVNQRAHVAHLYSYLNARGVPTLGLCAERGKRDRSRAMAAIRAGGARVIVATDTAARGLDIAGLDLVIHYAPARDAETYIHRSGRTGRAGRPGVSLTLVAGEERGWMRRLAGEVRNLAPALAPAPKCPGAAGPAPSPAAAPSSPSSASATASARPEPSA